MRIISFLRSNVGSILIGLLFIVLIFNPSAKAWVISGLMKVGLFQPEIENQRSVNGESEMNVLPDGLIFIDEHENPLSLSEQRGKVLFINFWATWCPPCIAEMSSINQLYHKFKDNEHISFFMVDVDASLTASTAFMKKNNYRLPVYSSASAIPKNILDGSIPTTLIVDKQGNIVFNHKGAADYSNPKIVKFLEELLK